MRAGVFFLALFVSTLTLVSEVQGCVPCGGADYCTRNLFIVGSIIPQINCIVCVNLITVRRVFFIKDSGPKRDFAWLWLEGDDSGFNNTKRLTNKIVEVTKNALTGGGGFNDTTVKAVAMGPGGSFGTNGTLTSYADASGSAGQWFRFFVPKILGDPHFTGLNGEAYDVQAEPNKVLNLISDTSLSVNALFVRPRSFEEASKNVTFLGHVSIQTPGHTMLLNPVSCDVTVDEDLVIPRNSGSVAQHGAQELSLTLSFKNIIVESSGLKLNFMCINKDRTAHFNLVAAYESGYHTSRGLLLPHGILGQTADREAREGVPGSQQGEGILDGVWTDYVVGEGMENIMNTQFTYSRFIPIQNPSLQH